MGGRRGCAPEAHDPMAIVTTVPVRDADIDAAGHVYFGHFFTFAHEGFMAFLDARGLDLERRTQLGFQLVAAHAEMDYRGRVLRRDTVELHAEVERLGRTSLTTRISMLSLSNREPVADGKLVHVCVGLKNLVPQPWPEAAISILQLAG